MVLNPPSSSEPGAAPGIYRFSVGSAAEAVDTIRARLGPTARVVSVQNQPRGAFGRIFGSPRFEVVAELPPPPAPEPVATPRVATEESLVLSEPRLPSVLRRAGFPERLLGRLEASPGWRAAAHRPLHEALADLARDLRAAARPPRPLPARVAFLGAAGVGRTTALCKWLAREVFTQSRTGTVWKVEFDRPNPAPALEVFCEALGVPLEHYAPGATGAPSGDFLFADLPGLPAVGSRAARDCANFLERERMGGRVLVLNAAYDADALRAAYARGRDFGATHLVCTHLDEAPRCGRLWEFLLEGELAPLFLGTGPGLTGDLETDVLETVLRRSLPLRGEDMR
jgi:flagellar biosynthesis protein FlhF